MTNSALKKRTQKSRSNDTINKILTATTDTIYEVGFHNTTTSRIALKAGVSRGALLHHFPRKEILIAEAVRFMLRKEIEEIERLAENVQNDRLSIDEFLDILWEHFSGPHFHDHYGLPSSLPHRAIVETGAYPVFFRIQSVFG